MGNTESIQPRTILDNFSTIKNVSQYTNDSKVLEIVPWYLLEYIKYELKGKAWKWDIYKDIFEKVDIQYKDGGDENAKFCVLTKIYEEIYKKILNNEAKNGEKYSWELYGKPLVEKTKQENKFADNICVGIETSKISQLITQYDNGEKRNNSNSCSLNLAKELPISPRRLSLSIDKLNNIFKDVKRDIDNGGGAKDALEKKLAVELSVNAFTRIVEKRAENLKDVFGSDKEGFCNIWYRDIEDYLNILNATDIVNDNSSVELQCLIKNIQNQIGTGTNYQQLLRDHFKEPIKEQWEKYGKQKGLKCVKNPENITQCLRFFEEIFINFCDEKKKFAKRLYNECNTSTAGSTKSNTSQNCTTLCSGYKSWLGFYSKWYDNFKKTCIDKKYGEGEKKVQTLQDNNTKIVEKIIGHCCKGTCKDEDLFNVNILITNKGYNCMCNESNYKTTQNGNSTECNKFKQEQTASGTLQGKIVDPQTQRTASQSGNSGPTSGTTATAPTSTNSIMEIAQKVLEGAKKQLGERGGSSLVGDISKAIFKNGTASGLGKDDICKLEKNKHTNDWRDYSDDPDAVKGNVARKHGGPCTGKGTKGIGDGKTWEKNSDAHTDHKDVLFPPRRLDMCTSNLESLNTDYEGLKDASVNHSFLGDVLLAAKTEADKIIELYKDANVLNGKENSSIEQKHKESMCSAIKASFADLGDIIRGTDMWGNNSDQKKLQEHLDKIFQKIQQNLSNSGNSSYNSGKGESPPYKTLREDWWNANRDQIWKAMTTCGNTTNICSDSSVPLDDYIPQTLRWTTEWSEDFCNKRKTLANKVVSECKKCKDASDEYHKKNTIDKSGGTGTGGAPGKKCGDNGKSDPECTDCNKKCDACKQACEAYKNFVSSTGSGTTNKNNWRQQWENMNTRYQYLMGEARSEIEKKQKEAPTSSGTGGTSTTTCNSGSNQCAKSFYEYLYDNGYTTLSSYISKMSQNTECGNDKHVVTTNTCGITYI
ncbi:erythrocyte membrane protein 1, PfEMP1, putative [Plasmodium gaboni]|uniref:Erythrocyte membrane protein 1, PfEMP1, putative n=1 Tax=Plasmodium gaboni TaxID=647221 RepID=A0ABY1UV69_9APIC|nr:erythrocyte membrane protein 1, PfEMP1, putative [Plasmodium gaboni]